MRYALIICNIQTNKNFNKLHLIIHQISNLKTLLIFQKYVLQSFFVIDATLASDNFCVSERIFQKEYKN